MRILGREGERERRAGYQVSDEWRRYSFLRERLELSVSQRDHRDTRNLATSVSLSPHPLRCCRGKRARTLETLDAAISPLPVFRRGNERGSGRDRSF